VIVPFVLHLRNDGPAFAENARIVVDISKMDSKKAIIAPSSACTGAGGGKLICSLGPVQGGAADAEVGGDGGDGLAAGLSGSSDVNLAGGERDRTAWTNPRERLHRGGVTS
jgi:hypothetical protein